VPTFCPPKITVPGIPNWPGLAPAPVPLAEKFCGLPVPVLVTVNVAFLAPDADGLNAMPTWQLPPAATDAQLLLVMMNSAGLLLTTLDIVTDWPPMLVIVAVCDALCTLSAWLPNDNAAGIWS